MPDFSACFLMQKFREEKKRDDFPDALRPSNSGLGCVEPIASVEKWPL